MTVSDLSYNYEFHDCTMFYPEFKQNGDTITCSFELAKFLQFPEIKRKYGEKLDDKNTALVLTVEFLKCSDIDVEEEVTVCNGKANRHTKHPNCERKKTTLADYDKNIDFLSLSLCNDGDERRVSATFFNFSNKCVYVQFHAEEVNVLYEDCVDKDTCEKLWNDWENS